MFLFIYLFLFVLENATLQNCAKVHLLRCFLLQIHELQPP